MNNRDQHLLDLYQDINTIMKETIQYSKDPHKIGYESMVSNLAKTECLIKAAWELEPNTSFKRAMSLLLSTTQRQHHLVKVKLSNLQSLPTNRPPADPESRPTNLIKKTKDEKLCRQVAIDETIFQPKKVSFDDVVGLEEVKQVLREAVIMPLQYPQLFTGGREPWKRILLYGPPGTGKSYLAQALATEIQAPFYCVSSSDLVSSLFGESEKMIKELFQRATSSPERSVIFIDEIDSICRQRTSREDECTRRIKTELLKQMQGADNSERNIFLLCATNCPWDLDSAFLRRFQKRIFVPLPTKSARLELLKKRTKDTAVCVTEEQWESLADMTEGYSGSDIATMVLGALFEPIRRLQHATHWLIKPDGKLVPCASNIKGSVEAKLSQLPTNQVTADDLHFSDLITSLYNHTLTITSVELSKFEHFTRTYGQLGY